MRDSMLQYFQAEKQEALLFLAVGAVALERTPEADPPTFRSAESARMTGVMSSFRDDEVIEIVLIAVGIGLTAVFPQRQALYAVGVGLVAQAAFMLVLDLFAAQRGRAYLDALSRLS